MEIVEKLCDSEFAKRAQAAGFLGKAWDVLRDAGAGRTSAQKQGKGRGDDKVLNTTLAFFAALVAKDPADIIELAHLLDADRPHSLPR